MIEIRSLRDLLRLFFIFRHEFKWAVITTLVVAVLGAFLWPPSYESNARLLVQPGRNSTTLPIEMANRQALVSQSTQRDPVVDEEKMLTSRTVVDRVAQRVMDEMSTRQPEGFWKTLKHYIKVGLNGAIEGLRTVLQTLGIVEAKTDVQRLTKKLEKHLSVGHEQGSTVIDISFTWDDPAVAQQIVRIWLEVYMDTRAQSLGRESLQSFYQEELKVVAERIRVLKETLQDKLKRVDSINVIQRLQNLTEQINTITEDRNNARNRLAGLDRYLESARRALKDAPRELVASREISLNPTQLDLKQQLNDLKVERARLLRTYTQEAPGIQIIDRNIAEVQALIAKERDRIESTQTLDRNTLVTEMEKQIVEAELEKDQLRGQIEQFEQQLSELRTTRNQVLAEEPEISRLQLELTSAEQSFALYSENLEKARIDHALDTSQISNIAQIEPATFNPSRVFPKSLLILLLALPVGTLVGLLTIYLCYLLDQRIHDGARVGTLFGVPLWSSLPELAPDRSNLSALTAAIYRLYSALPHQQIAEQGAALAFTSARGGEGVSFVVKHLAPLLKENGYQVTADVNASHRPGQVLLLDAPAIQTNADAFASLHKADHIVLILEAGTSTIPAIEHALSLLKTAFGKVDGIVLNRRRFEVPARLLNALGRVRSSR